MSNDWLNDICIDLFIDYLRKKSAPQHYYFHSFFFTQLKAQGYSHSVEVTASSVDFTFHYSSFCSDTRGIKTFSGMLLAGHCTSFFTCYTFVRCSLCRFKYVFIPVVLAEKFEANSSSTGSHWSVIVVENTIQDGSSLFDLDRIYAFWLGHLTACTLHHMNSSSALADPNQYEIIWKYLQAEWLKKQV